MNEESFYEILGVDQDATKEEIKKAFRQKSMQMHPDVGGKIEDFNKLHEAFQTLYNEENRKFYDQTGKAKKNSIDMQQEAEQFLIQLYEEIIDSAVNLNGYEILEKLNNECVVRKANRKRALQYLHRHKAQFEDKLGCIEKEGCDETIFDKILKKKINSTEQEIALAEVDIKILERVESILKDYHPRKGEEDRDPNTSIFAKSIYSMVDAMEEEQESKKSENFLENKEK